MATKPKPEPDPAPTVEVAAAAPMPAWRYTGPVERLYMSVPVTVAPGDIVAWPTIPAEDGCWEPDAGPATTLPDNHPTTEA